jgi:hypothetical protein
VVHGDVTHEEWLMCTDDGYVCGECAAAEYDKCCGSAFTHVLVA